MVYNNNHTILTSQQEYEIPSDSNKKLAQPFMAKLISFAIVKNVYTVFEWNLQSWELTYLGKFLFRSSLPYYSALSETRDADVLNQCPSCTEHRNVKSNKYVHFTITI